MRLPQSALAEHPAHDVSQAYSFIPTTNALRVFERKGWVPTSCNEKHVRKAEYLGYQKHLIRLQRQGDITYFDRGLRPEIILINSHDRGSSFQVMAGLFRMACANGLIVSDGVFMAHRIIHSGYTEGKVFQAIESVEESIPAIFSKVILFQGVQVSEEKRVEYAELSAKIRWPKADKFPIDPGMLVNTYKRREDTHEDLWTVYNRVQENLLGGVHYRARYRREFSPTADQYVSPKLDSTARGSSREVTSIDERVRINRELWKLTEDFATVG